MPTLQLKVVLKPVSPQLIEHAEFGAWMAPGAGDGPAGVFGLRRQKHIWNILFSFATGCLGSLQTHTLNTYALTSINPQYQLSCSKTMYKSSQKMNFRMPCCFLVNKSTQCTVVRRGKWWQLQSFWCLGRKNLSEFWLVEIKTETSFLGSAFHCAKSRRLKIGCLRTRGSPNQQVLEFPL